MLLEVSTEHGEIEQGEREMLYKVFDFADKEASDVMVPRPEVVGISIEMAPEEALRAVLESPYTRYPVYRESLDEIVGILHVRDLVSALHDSAIAEVELAALLRPAYVVPETKDLAALLAEFRRTNQHMSVVVDEYGATQGIVTLEDLLEEIVGEIEDEFDLPDESVERVERDDDPDRRHVPDRRLQRGVRDDARARGLPHGRRVRLRPDRPGRGARRRGAVGRPAVHGAGRRGLEDPAARGGVPAGARAGRRGRRGGVDRNRSTRSAGDSPLRHRDFVLFLGVMLATGLRDRDVVRRDRLAGVRGAQQSARSRARRAGDVHPAAAPRAAGRAPRRPLSAPHAARDRDRDRHRGHARPARRHARRRRRDVAVLPARVRDGCRLGARRAGLACPDAVARAARDPRAGARLQVGRLPGVGDRRAGARRAAVRAALRARLRRRGGAVGGRAAGDAAAARRPRPRRRVVARPRERARRCAPRATDARAARRDLARPLRRPVRRRGRAAARLREGRPRGRAGRARAAPRRSGRRRALLGDRADAAAGAAARGTDAAHGGRPLRRLDRRLRPLADDVAVAARARGRRCASTW